MPRTIVVLLIAVALAFAGTAGCSRKTEPNASKQEEKIVLAVSPQLASAPVYVAHEKGYFKNEGLDVTLHSYASGQLALDAVLSGRADLATVAETPVAGAALAGKRFSVIATICEIDRAILLIARKDRGISAPGDLRGRRIGVAPGTAADFFLHIYLTTSHIDPMEVRIVNLAPDKIVGALLNGEVDAVSAWAPLTIVLRDKLGSNAQVLQDPGIYTMTWNIAAKQYFVKNNPERIRRFLRPMIRANSFIREQPAESRAVSARNLGTDSALFDREWENYHFAVALDQSLILNLEDQARWMIKREGGSPRSTPNFLEFIYTDCLKAVKPDAVRIPGR